jgi:16S rRNA (cytosine967-C5)-methyltransferase
LSVQDEAAQLPGEVLQCPPTGRILDACAAPGGKTGQLCEKFPDADVVALELEGKRLARIRENLARLNADITLLQGDASDPQSWWDGTPFDAILLDAPCSATGILRRQPDVKWHRKASDIPALVDLQARMLDALWPLLKPGGMLVYATCSVLRDENDHQVSAFLQRQPQARDVTPRPEGATMVSAGWQLFPQHHGPDGFYLACLRKESGALA